MDGHRNFEELRDPLVAESPESAPLIERQRIKLELERLDAAGLLTWQLAELGRAARRELLAEHRRLKRGPCALCGRNPAAGYASIGNDWYCHGDFDPDPTCYMRAQWLQGFRTTSERVSDHFEPFGGHPATFWRTSP